MKKRIVLLHGWGASTSKLLPLEQELQKLDWETVNLQLPGFDLPAPDQAWGIPEYADYVNRHIKEKCVIFGHSFGGRVAIYLAAQKSEKIAGVILCAPGGLSRTLLVKRILFKGLTFLGKLLRLDKYKWLVYKLAREHDYEKTTGVMREVFKKVVALDLWSFLRQNKLPTLVIWGDQDKVAPVQNIPHAKMIIIKNQGHRLPYELPERVAKEINIWSQSLN